MSILPRLSWPFAILLTVAGCSPTPTPTEPAEQIAVIAVGEATLPAAEYLNRAAQSSGDAQQAYLLLATRAHMDKGEIALAKSAYAQIQQPLNLADQRIEFALLGAELAIAEGTPALAIEQLNGIDKQSLPNKSKISAYQLTASAQAALGNQIEAARALVTLDPSLNASQQRENHTQIWNYLKPLTIDELEANQQAPAPDQLTGWLKLMALTKRMSSDPSKMTDALEQWRNEFPTHAAAQNLPPELEKALATMPFTPKNIAVLLPLTGRYQSQGEAIRDGLVYGYLQGIPSDTKITFYDTASEGAIKAFEQATLDQTDFIIGPLLKGNIETILSQGALTVPLLALNQADITSPDPLLFQFPLAPEDEAAQTAQRIWDDGHRYPLLLLPKGGFGERISDAFTQRWHAILASQGIAIDDDNQQSIEQRFFKDRKTMQKLIEQALGVSESQARIRHMKSLLGNSIEVEPRSRRDLDAIYLIATPIDARLLKPFVDVTVSPFANPLPIYASSRSHELGVTTSQNRELAGVMFSEIPMLLPETEQQSQLQAQSNKLWPTRRAAEQRLFALGMDAYQIIPLLAQMRAFPGYSFDGLTGQLKISDEGQVHRELNWAKITSNGVELMPRKANESTTKAQQP